MHLDHFEAQIATLLYELSLEEKKLFGVFFLKESSFIGFQGFITISAQDNIEIHQLSRNLNTLKKCNKGDPLTI